MKRVISTILLSFIVLLMGATFVFAADAPVSDAEHNFHGMAVIGAGIAVGVAAIGAGLGQGIATGKWQC